MINNQVEPHGLLAIALLLAMLVIGVYSDLRGHRIPNALTLPGLAAALSLQVTVGGLPGLVSGLLGAVIGLACFAPFYLLRGMGAGDVKLLAAVGAFLGPFGVLYAALISLLAGGAGAIGFVVWRALCASIRTIVHDGIGMSGAAAFVAARLARRERLPFALPIAIGGIAACWYLTDFSAGTAWLRGALT